MISIQLILKVPQKIPQEMMKRRSAQKKRESVVADSDVPESFTQHRSRRQSLAEIKKAMRVTPVESGDSGESFN